MQLNQPIPPTYSGGEDPYDFILKGNQKPKKSLLPSGSSRKNRIILVAGGGLALLFLLIIIMTVISSNSSKSTKGLIEIAQSQTEITRISTNGSNLSRNTTVKGFSESVNLTISTGLIETTKYMSSHGNKVKTKTLSLTKSAQTDAALKSASESGRYDDELLKTLEKELSDYKVLIGQTYKQATIKSQKTLLQNLFDQVVNLTKNQPTSS
jgi:hypothetical protein